jgi:hypothetical protein
LLRNTHQASDEGDYVTNGKNETWEHASEGVADMLAKLNRASMSVQFAQLNAAQNRSEKNPTPAFCEDAHNSRTQVMESK